jgi:hypothetical protein
MFFYCLCCEVNEWRRERSAKFSIPILILPRNSILSHTIRACIRNQDAFEVSLLPNPLLLEVSHERFLWHPSSEREGRRERRETLLLFEMLSTSQAGLILYFTFNTERLITALCDCRFLFNYSAYYLIFSEQNANIRHLNFTDKLTLKCSQFVASGNLLRLSYTIWLTISFVQKGCMKCIHNQGHNWIPIPGFYNYFKENNVLLVW